MAKKSRKQAIPKAPVPEKKAEPVKNSDTKGISRRYLNFGVPFGVVIFVFFVLRDCLDNLFTNWDDPGYVTKNPLVKSLSATGIKDIFSTPVMGNYHPLTILSYAFDYQLGQYEPFGYHLHSLLLHLLVCGLVYWFTYLLTKLRIAAAIAALLFGVHPMHVESVAWIAGRKDLLMSLFSLLSFVCYLYYVRCTGNKKALFFLGSFVLFGAALLSKPVAVALPVVLVLIDYFEVRTMTWKVWVEKLPYLALSVGMGLKSVTDQAQTGAIKTTIEIYSAFERIELGCYALCTYLWKLLIPAPICSFYNYPAPINGSLPGTYLVYPVLVVALIFLLWRFCRENRLVVFGLVFFIVNIALLLQFVPVGDAIVADRYTYLPYFGFFLIIGRLAGGYIDQYTKTQKAYAVLAGVAGYIIILSCVSAQRCKVWHDTLSLWQDVDKQQPGTPLVLNGLGDYYFEKFNAARNDQDKKMCWDSAFFYLNEEMKVDSNYFNSNFILGMLYAYNNNIPAAKKYFYKTLSLRRADNKLMLEHTKDVAAQAYLFLGAIYATTQNFDSAAFCNRTAIATDSTVQGIHMQYGKYFSMVGKFDSAIVEYGKAIAEYPKYYEGYFWRGEAELRLDRNDQALADFDKAIESNPNIGMVYYDRAIGLLRKGDKKQALQDVQKAQSLGFNQINKDFYEALMK